MGISKLMGLGIGDRLFFSVQGTPQVPFASLLSLQGCFRTCSAKADIAGVRERTRCTRFVDEVISRVQCLWVVSLAHPLTLEASPAQR